MCPYKYLVVVLVNHNDKTSVEPSPPSSIGNIQLKIRCRKGYETMPAIGVPTGETGWKFSGKGCSCKYVARNSKEALDKRKHFH